jgi:nitrate/nitrite transporter NarK
MESLPGVTPANVGVAAGVWIMAVNTGVFFLPLIFGSILASTGGTGGTGGLWAILIGYGVALLAMLAARDNHVMEVKAADGPV